MTVAAQEIRPPSGIVTFLLTDIEGSTGLFRSLGDAYAELLAEHHRLIRAAIAGHGGTEIKTEGDAVLVAFTRVVDAIAAALDAQLALATHGWPAGAEVRVRMGVHVGDARVIDGDYVSFALHQCTRVAASGHGGQVLLSAAAARLAEGALPPSASLVDLGPHELRDFESPERLYQLLHPELPQAFPPLRAPAHRAGEDADQLLRLAEAAFMVGDLQTVIGHLSAAAPVLAAGGRARDAAMVCARLVIVFEVLYNKIAARAWYTRAVRLVEREPPCLEQGYAAVAQTGCLVDDPKELLARADLALDRARRFGDATLEVKALADGGLARVQAGAVVEGMSMLDEAIGLACGVWAADPFVIGRAICSFFTACYYTADFERFRIWSEVLHAQGVLCEPPIAQAFLTGHCRSVQGTLLCLVGQWGEADDLLTQAYAESEGVAPGVVWHPPIALAELRTLQGRLAEAEALLLGREYLMEALLPTARLYLARGDFELACATARRGLRLIREDRVRASSLLGVLVEAELGKGDLEQAREASAELDARTQGLGVPALEVYATRLRAQVSAAEGCTADALAALQEALALLSAADLPRLEALVRLDLARFREATGELAEAVLEARAAAALLARLDMMVEAGHVELLARLGVRLASRLAQPGSRVAILDREGGRWFARFDGKTVALGDLSGFRYLAQLIAHPGTPRHVFDLFDEVGGPWTSPEAAGETVPDATATDDPTGRARRRRRVSELRDQLDDALAERDHDRASALKEELDTEIADFVAVLDAGMTVDQLRRRVTRAIRGAIARIAEAVPEAGAFLEQRVHTGTLCAYEADPDDGVVWRVRLST